MTGLTFGSGIYRSAWSTPEMRHLFDDVPRTRQWLEMLAVLAEIQGRFGLIPAESAAQVAETCRAVEIDDVFLREFADGYSSSGHSMAGLITAIKHRCPGTSGEWFYYGATVQDITDSWMMIALKEARTQILASLEQAIKDAKRLCEAHRSTVMPGRTHGQQGLPVTFGYKVASWLMELLRHRARLTQQAERMDIGQLCGGVGSLSAMGPHGIEIQEEFCKEVGLRPPVTSWIVSRDILVEWGQVLTLITGTADRVGHEVYLLQRDEIGELREGATREQVGSITMPHKRNPEISEHLGTLARVVRTNSAALSESQTHDHERDGRSWKLEWHAVPELTVAAEKTVRLLADLLSNLEINKERMRHNLAASDDRIYSESLMLALAGRVGKQTAHAIVHRISGDATQAGIPFRKVVQSDQKISEHLCADEIRQIFDPEVQTGKCAALVDRVLSECVREG